MKQILRYSFIALMAMIMGNAFAQGTTFNFDDDYATLFPNLAGQSSNDSHDGDFTEATTSTAIDGFTVTVSAAAEGVNNANRIWSGSPRLRMYSGTFTVKGTGIKKIEFTSSNNKFNLSTETGTLDGTTWTGEADEVVFTVGGNTQLNSLVINAESSGEEVHIANTAETAYTVAKAIELIDAGEALTEEVYVKGKISQLDKFNSDGSITYWISDDGTTTNQFECYKGKGLEGASFTSIEDLKKGSTVIVKGLLTKYNSTYELNAGNTLVSYDESTAVEEQHIANTAETAYTVAEAIELINAGNSLSETVYIKGIVSQVDQFKDSYKSIDYWISDDGTTESAQFECYSGKGIDGADFESIDDIKVGAKVIVKGVMKKYKDTYEFDYNNELVSYEYTTDTWTVAGTYPLVDKSWDPSDASADMTSTDGVNFTYEKEGIVLEKGTEYKFKVAKNHSWDEAYPGSDYILTVDETATYTVTITFNASTTEVGVEKVKTGSASAVEHTYGLVGTLVGSWDDDVEMVKGDDGLYTAVVTDVAAGDYEFKVRADKSWDINYPSSNYQLTVEQDNSTVTVTFNEETKEVNATVDSATGISTAKNVNMNNAQIFNLAGQRVEKVTKGIYIQNGKKFIVK